MGAYSYLKRNVKVGFLHSIDFLFLVDHRDYVNLIIFKQVLKSYCYWTECPPPLTLLIHRSPISKYSLNASCRRSIFSTVYLLASMATFSRVGSKKFRSLRSRAYSHQQFQNVTTAVECSALVLL